MIKLITKAVRNHLGFSSVSTKGAVLLFPFLLLSLLSPVFLHHFFHKDHLLTVEEERHALSEWKAQITRNIVRTQTSDVEESLPEPKKYKRKKSPPETFAFDPNEATVSQFQRLGFSDKTAL